MFISTLVLGTFFYSISEPIILDQQDEMLKNRESSDLFPDNSIVSEEFDSPQQGCCGHVDVTGPSILLISPALSVWLSG